MALYYPHFFSAQDNELSSTSTYVDSTIGRLSKNECNGNLSTKAYSFNIELDYKKNYYFTTLFETMRDQQEQGRRPRMSLKDIIRKNDIKSNTYHL